MVYKFFVKKTGSRVSVNEELGEELKVAKCSKEGKFILVLKIIFGQKLVNSK